MQPEQMNRVYFELFKAPLDSVSDTVFWQTAHFNYICAQNSACSLPALPPEDETYKLFQNEASRLICLNFRRSPMTDNIDIYIKPISFNDTIMNCMADGMRW